MRRGNLELIDLMNCEIASLCSQRRLKDFFNSLLGNVFLLLLFVPFVSFVISLCIPVPLRSLISRAGGRGKEATGGRLRRDVAVQV